MGLLMKRIIVIKSPIKKPTKIKINKPSRGVIRIVIRPPAALGGRQI